MKKIKIFSRFIAVAVVISLLCSASIVSVYASSGTKYESESNNTVQTATRTYDDYDNYGKLSYYGDTDYWLISFAYEGMANFWLGDIPGGCDYSILVYERLLQESTHLLVAVSSSLSSNQEFLRLNVKDWNSAEYYVLVSSYNYSYNANSYYHLRVKNTPTLSSKYYSYDTTYNNMIVGYNTFSRAPYSANLLSTLGFDDGAILYKNTKAQTVYDSIPQNDIVVLSSRGFAGYMYLPSSEAETLLYANTEAPPLGWDRVLASYDSGALSNVSLIVFMGQYTGLDGSTADNANLVDIALSKGAYNAIGWTSNVNPLYIQYWFEDVLEVAIENPISIGDVMDIADSYYYTSTSNLYHPVHDRYAGNNYYLYSTYPFMNY